LRDQALAFGRNDPSPFTKFNLPDEVEGIYPAKCLPIQTIRSIEDHLVGPWWTAQAASKGSAKENVHALHVTGCYSRAVGEDDTRMSSLHREVVRPDFPRSHQRLALPQRFSNEFSEGSE